MGKMSVANAHIMNMIEETCLILTTVLTVAQRWTEATKMDDEKCPCETCANKESCDGWDAAYCCILCDWLGGGDCENCDPWDL